MAALDTTTFRKILTEQFDKQARLINSAFQGQKNHFDKQFDDMAKGCSRQDRHSH